jgi:hypothetical protein
MGRSVPIEDGSTGLARASGNVFIILTKNESAENPETPRHRQVWADPSIRL